MVDLSGLAAFGAGFGNQMPEAQRRYLALQQQRMELDAARRLIAAQSAAGSAFGDDSGIGGLPGSRPLPGAPAPPQGGPAPQVTPGQLALRLGPQGLIPAQGAPPLQGPMPGTQAGPQPQIGGGQPMPLGGTLTVEQLAERIRRRNPNIDGATLFEAVKQASAVLNPESRMLLQFLMAQQRVGATERGQDIRKETAERGQDMSSADRMAAIKARLQGIGMQQAGADRRAAGGGPGGAGSLTTEDADFLAQTWMAGDRTVTQGLGYGKVGAANRAKVLASVVRQAKERGASGEELAQARTEFMGAQAGQRTVGTQSARIGIGSRELDRFSGPLVTASRAVDRTQYPTWNAVQLAVEKGTGSPQVVKLIAAVNAFKNAYAQIVARGGQSTDDARRRADEIMNAAWSQGQVEAGIEQMKIEADAALQAAGDVRSDISGGIRMPGRAPGGPAVGTVQDGYRFRGGDPGQQSSWEKVQ